MILYSIITYVNCQPPIKTFEEPLVIILSVPYSSPIRPTPLPPMNTVDENVVRVVCDTTVPNGDEPANQFQIRR